jgi:hypothetical protein
MSHLNQMAISMGFLQVTLPFAAPTILIVAQHCLTPSNVGE